MSLTTFIASATRSLFKPLVVERPKALEWSSALASLTHAMSSVEHLVNRAERQPGGANYWEITRNSGNFRNPITRRIIEFAARPAVTDALHITRLAAFGVSCLPHTPTRVRGAIALYLSATAVILAPRHHFGGDGSDQLSALTTAMTGLARVSGSPRIADAALWGLSLQGSLAYLVSGWVKVAGPRWRNGTALLGVMRTRVYGHERFWRLLKDYPILGKILERTTLVIECAFPLVYFAQGRLTRSAILAAGSMHIAIMMSMALGRFLPAFSSLYPAIAYTTVPSKLLASPRSDRTPVVLGVLAGALATGLQFDRNRRSRQAHADLPGYSQLALPSGGAVMSRRSDPNGADATPAVILVHGLGSTSALWSTTAALLSDRGVSTLVYDREAERSAVQGRRGLDDAVDELCEIIRSQYPGREVILVGHSLGGLICYRAAQRSSEQVRAVVLLDSTHPRQLEQSPVQRDMTAAVKSNIAVTAGILSAGFGRFMIEPGWVQQTPEDLRPTLTARSRDARVWWSALWEWTAAEQEFDRQPELGAADFAILSITAGTTNRLDPTITELHRDYAAQSHSGRHLVLEGFHHNDIVFDAAASDALVSEIAALTAPQEASR